MKRKLGFPLSVNDNWPPYDVEHIWAEEVGNLFRVKNFPFFLKGLAYDDILSVEFGVDNYVEKWSIVTPSSNSTIWIIEHEFTDITEKLAILGCGTEREASHKLISVNVPQSVNRDELDLLLHEHENLQLISVAVPVDRMDM